MTDTVEKKEEVVEKKEEIVEEVPRSDIELEAMDQGWLPKEEWEESGRDPSEWRSAKEFKERGEFFKTIHQLKRENRQNTAALDSMKKHHQFVFDQAYRRAKAELRKERREALRADDVDTAEAVDEQIEKLDEEYQTQKAELVKIPVDVQTPPEFDAWRARNGWYDGDEDLRDFADAIGMVYTRKNPGIPPERVLKHVETEVKKKFPEKFGVRKAAPNAVASVDRTKTGRKSAETYELDETETHIMNDLVRAGVMTKAEYIADLKKIKGE